MSLIRARELGLDFGTLPTGKFNAITDVPGVTVGHVSLIRGQGRLIPGQGPVRTGITAVLPHGGNLYTQKCPAAVFPFNGYGKSIGMMYVEELGLCENPILITNTLSIAAALEGGLDWVLKHNPGVGISERTPNITIFECDDGYLNDTRGRHLQREHAYQAIATATGGPVPEGNVGAGVGMSTFAYKSGVGTSSRIVKNSLGTWTLGVLMACNFGEREDLIIKGIPFGRMFPVTEAPSNRNSNITIIATDAPLSYPQLKRLAKRPPLGLSRVGNICRWGCGNIEMVFTNYPWIHPKAHPLIIDNRELLDPLIVAVIDACEEACLNALFQSETMVGVDNHVREKLPVEQIIAYLRNSNRLRLV
ncbi:MAG TPA: P1 family peptidase [Candidatus Deferrimicrobium sp.]|nr:P1 family peptidase [Candidatus Deferrimicrobium sp.]